ncbi:MAG: formate dehydrogenase subunit alpha [Piscirickettsiaceae bacterium]|nr:MAG: formate dehydrogenase subunit alpha [Piscirickettsiaceae bacterium]
MTDNVSFTLDGQPIKVSPNETIWQVAKRVGTNIPHLCFKDSPGYRSDGNCRACMVEIDGERTLAASCHRYPSENMVVHTQSKRAISSRRLVMELLSTDLNEQTLAGSFFNRNALSMQLQASRFPEKRHQETDLSHPAITVQHDACIHCNLCVRACRDVQVNDVIGLSYRGSGEKITFDFNDPMGDSTCVACGECVQACPTNALSNRTHTGNSIDNSVRSVCPYCGVGCQINIHTSNNHIVAVDGANGPANEERLCVKGRFGFDYLSSPQRLTEPLIRKPGLPKGINIDPANPYTHFRKASWEEALDIAANGFQSCKTSNGRDALAGFGSAKCSNEEAYLFQKLVRTGFGNNNVDHCTRLCHASSVSALMQTIGSGAVTAPFTAVRDSNLIIVIGANPNENHPVAASYFKQAAKTGTELIVMDPRAQSLKHYATHMLQFVPGTDVALLNAIMYVIVDEKLYNDDYIQRHTAGFTQQAKHLKSFSPELMQGICGISADEIRVVARKYARAKAAIIFWGMGISQHTHGTDNARCLISLALMCGHIGKPGTGLHPLRGQNNVQGASDAALIPMFFPDYQKTDDPEAHAFFEQLWSSALQKKPGLTVVEIIDAIHSDTIKSMYIMGENPAMSDPNLNHARAALAKLEHLVVQDIFLTETAMFADVVLPATAWPEKSGTVTNTNRQVQMGRQAVDAPGNAKADWWIIQQIANRLQLSWSYQNPETIYAEMQQAMPSLSHIDWQRLTTEHSVTYPCSSNDQPGQEIVFSDKFPTPSGLGLFVPASFFPPNDIIDDQYPFILTTGRQLEHWHTGSMTRRSELLNELEPEAFIQMSHTDALALSIEAGDLVTVTSRRGTINIHVRIDSALQQGLIFMPFAFVESAANILTSADLDPDGKIPEFKFSTVNIKPIKKTMQ